MTKDETIADLTAKLAKKDGQIARLKKRLQAKMKYEKGYLQVAMATPQFVDHIEQKDKAALQDY